VRLVAWNVNCRARATALPPALPRAVLSLVPDVVVLTEYVPARSHEELLDELETAGLSNVAMSDSEGSGKNRVLIASRYSIGAVSRLDPEPALHAASNYLHVRLVQKDPAENVDLLGIRIPYYKASSHWRTYWTWFSSHLRQLLAPRQIVIGDLNVDPFKPRASWMARELRAVVDLGWQLPSADGEWSYWSTGTRSKLDHALVGPGLRTMGARYVARNAEHVLAGPGPGEPLSDHAPLVIEVVEAPCSTSADQA
jgi:exonuclease III